MGNDVIRELRSSSLGTEFVSQLDHRSRGKVLIRTRPPRVDLVVAVGNELQGALVGSGERTGGRGMWY
jgi:hypothetical protein